MIICIAQEKIKHYYKKKVRENDENKTVLYFDLILNQYIQTIHIQSLNPSNIKI